MGNSVVFVSHCNLDLFRCYSDSDGLPAALSGCNSASTTGTPNPDRPLLSPRTGGSVGTVAPSSTPSIKVPATAATATKGSAMGDKATTSCTATTSAGSTDGQSLESSIHLQVCHIYIIFNLFVILSLADVEPDMS